MSTGTSLDLAALNESLSGLERWMEEHDYKGYDPFDGLTSVLRPLTFRNLFLDRALMQLVKRTPFHIRPILGIKPLDSAIARGYMARGYLLRHEATGDADYARKAIEMLDWLLENRSPGYSEYCWGKHFHYASRAGRYARYEPITVWSSLIGFAFLEAFETFEDERYLDVAESVCRWICTLSRNRTDSGFCVSYTATGTQGSTIHNHNMLAAALMAWTAHHRQDDALQALAREAMRYSCARQLPSGAWWYGEEPKYHWIDNFHTGYNLDSLYYYENHRGDSEFADNIDRGLRYYLDTFFEDDGLPKYYNDKSYPVDSQCLSQAIDTLCLFSPSNDEARTLSKRVAMWGICNMRDPSGFFWFRRYPRFVSKVPMVHWAQATMYKALASLERAALARE